MGNSGPQPAAVAFMPSKPIVYLEAWKSANERNRVLHALQVLSSDKLRLEVSGTEVHASDGRSNSLPIGTKLLRNLQDRTRKVVIRPPVGSFLPGTGVDPNDSSRILVKFEFTQLHFFTQAAQSAFSPPSLDIVVEAVPSYITLAHELIHAYRILHGITANGSIEHYFFDEPPPRYPQYQYKQRVSREELETCGINHRTHRPMVSGITENTIRDEHGLRLRTSYASPTTDLDKQGVNTVTNAEPDWWPSYPIANPINNS